MRNFRHAKCVFHLLPFPRSSCCLLLPWTTEFILSSKIVSFRCFYQLQIMYVKNSILVIWSSLSWGIFTGISNLNIHTFIRFGILYFWQIYFWLLQIRKNWKLEFLILQLRMTTGHLYYAVSWRNKKEILFLVELC